MTKSLILVTDMQSGFLDREKMTPEMREATDLLVGNVKTLIREALDHGNHVAFIEHVGWTGKGEFWRTLPELIQDIENPIVLQKRARGLFAEDEVNETYREASLEYLRRLSGNVGQIAIAGVNTGDCVLDTAQGLREEKIGRDIRILAGHTLRLLNPHLADRFQADNDLSFPLSGHGLWYKEEIMKFMPGYQKSGVDLIRKLKNPDSPLTI